MASAYAAPGTQARRAFDGRRSAGSRDPAGDLIQLQYMRKMQGMPRRAASMRRPGLTPARRQAQAAQDAAQAGIRTQTKLTQDKQADLLEARQKAPAALQQMTQMDTIADQIKGAKAGDTPVLQGILSSPTKKAAAMYLMSLHTRKARAASSTRSSCRLPLRRCRRKSRRRSTSSSSSTTRSTARPSIRPARGERSRKCKPPQRHQHARGLQPVLRRLHEAIRQLPEPAAQEHRQYLRRVPGPRQSPREISVGSRWATTRRT